MVLHFPVVVSFVVRHL